ncbi:MAG TPA: hypothetical protein VMO47_13115 [Rhodothermales bacterium]|nr:hypothetical protein [Rhodothermales bacterium]
MHKRNAWFSLHCLLVAGCASSAPAPTPKAEREPASTAPWLLMIDGNGIVGISDVSAAPETIQTGVTFAGLYSARSGAEDVVISVRNGSATQLALLAADGSFRTIHEHPGLTTYTLAWSPGGELAFGYSSAVGKGIGIYEPGGNTKDVGCSASSRALGWAASDRLVVADENNRYVVDASGCSTISRVDSRKMHEVTFNPERPLVAYVLRELEYDRTARQYVPDSSLYVSEPDGSNPRLVAGNRYRPHRPSWSPDGTELTFDARIPDKPDRRLISVYDTDQGASAFLNPESIEAPVSEWDARWSPGGSSIAYMQKYADGAPGLVVRPLNGTFTALVGEPGERLARWIDDHHLVVTNGTVERLVSTDGTTSIQGPSGATILRVD